MAAGIYFIDENDELTPMVEAPYQSEEVLQAMLARHPDLLAGDQRRRDTARGAGGVCQPSWPARHAHPGCRSADGERGHGHRRLPVWRDVHALGHDGIGGLQSRTGLGHCLITLPTP